MLVEDSNGIAFIAQNDSGNGFVKRILNDKQYREFKGNSIIIGRQTGIVYFQPEKFVTTDGVLVLEPSEFDFNKFSGLYFTALLQNHLNHFGYTNTVSAQKFNEIEILLPTIKSKIAFAFMENYIKALEAERIEMLESYLLVTNLKDYKLTEEEESALEKYDSYEWKFFDLERLFGKATRGRRLKSADRIRGMLPFVTAGEADTGISAFVGNDITIFSENTITIDMFGSAKYRNYKYGADDHVAVVHTEKNSKWANLFLTTCIHNVANSGKFSYSRNFYAKDADELNILLPVKDGKIDYDFMNHIGRAIEKMVIKDVVEWSSNRLDETKKVKAK